MKVDILRVIEEEAMLMKENNNQLLMLTIDPIEELIDVNERLKKLIQISCSTFNHKRSRFLRFFHTQ